MADCNPTLRWGARWCDAHDRRLARCELDAACAPVAPEHDGITIECDTHQRSIWVTCPPCSFTGPRRGGDPDTAFAMALLDRAAHLAGDDLLDLVDQADVVTIPTNEELLDA